MHQEDMGTETESRNDASRQQHVMYIALENISKRPFTYLGECSQVENIKIIVTALNPETQPTRLLTPALLNKLQEQYPKNPIPKILTNYKILKGSKIERGDEDIDAKAVALIPLIVQALREIDQSMGLPFPVYPESSENLAYQVASKAERQLFLQKWKAESIRLVPVNPANSDDLHGVELAAHVQILNNNKLVTPDLTSEGASEQEDMGRETDDASRQQRVMSIALKKILIHPFSHCGFNCFADIRRLDNIKIIFTALEHALNPETKPTRLSTPAFLKKLQEQYPDNPIPKILTNSTILKGSKIERGDEDINAKAVALIPLIVQALRDIDQSMGLPVPVNPANSDDLNHGKKLAADVPLGDNNTLVTPGPMPKDASLDRHTKPVAENLSGKTNTACCSNIHLQLLCGIFAILGAVALVLALGVLNVATAGIATVVTLAAVGGLLFFGGGIGFVAACRNNTGLSPGK